MAERPQFLLDADVLIKLNRAGVLQKVVESFDCIVPTAVYEEAVTEGKARLYEDAQVIERTLAGRVSIVDPFDANDVGVVLGPGETAILRLLPHYPAAVVVSDDRRFLGTLSLKTTSLLTSADVLFVLERSGILTNQDAITALEALRPAIRESAYKEIRDQLTS